MDDGLVEVGSRSIPPDPSIATAVGRHHSLSTAVADLVDNSIDAGAGRVLIRFVTEGGRPRGLRIIDDGRGMDDAAIDRAMTFGGKRDYDDADLGHFGLGLKAASLSQADRLDVYSVALGATSPAGRRIEASDPTRVAVLDSSRLPEVFAAKISALGRDAISHGTIVVWSGVRTFLSSAEPGELAAWLDETKEELGAHLGLVLHRILETGGVEISIDEFDLAQDAAGPARRVRPIDPLGYRGPARESLLAGEVTEGGFELAAHLWPAQQQSAPEFRLEGLPGGLAQGFYVYRNDRLLSAGGWNGVTRGGKDYDLVRVVLEVTPAVENHISINPEKSGVEFDAELRSAIEAAVTGSGFGFRDFLAEASAASAASRKRMRRPIVLSEVRRGLSPELRESISSSVVLSEHGPIEMRWKTLASGRFVEVDLDRRTLWLNTRHRRALGAVTGDADDLPLLKMLLLLLYSKYFEGSMLGAREKDELKVWEELMNEALDEELERRSYGEEPHHER